MSGEWLAQLPSDLKANDAFTSYETLGDFAKAHISTLGKVSELDGKVKESDGRLSDLTKRLENAVVVPGENATDAERASFYARLGRPDKPEGYELTKPAELPEGIAYNPDIEKQFSAFAHENGLSKAQAQKLYGWYFDLVKAGHAETVNQKADADAAVLKANEEAIGKLKTDWGPKYDANTKYAVRAFREFAKDNKDAVDLIEQAKVGNIPLGNYPAFLKVFHQIGLKIFGDKATFDGGGGGGDDTPEAQERQQAKMMFPSMNK